MLDIKTKLQKACCSNFWKELLKNVFIVLTGTGGASLVGLATTLILTHALGTTRFGTLVLAQQYMMVLDNLINFQSWQGVIKYGSEAVVNKDQKRFAAIIKSGFKIDIITASVGTLVAIAALPIARIILHWNQELLLLSALFSIEIIFHIEGTSVGVLRLLNKFNLTAIDDVVMSVCKFVLLGGYFLMGGKSLLVAVVFYVITDIIQHLSLLFIAVFVLSKKIGLKNVVHTDTKLSGKEFLHYTLWYNITSSVDIPVKYLDVFIVSQISVEMVAVYKVFKQFVSVLSRFTSPIAQAILPQLSELVAQHKIRDGYKKVLQIRNVIMTIVLLSAVAALFLAKPVLMFLLGKEYADHWFLFVLLWVLIGGGLSYVALHPFFAALGRPKSDFIITLASNIIYLIVSFLLVGRLDIYAVLLGTLAQYIIAMGGKQLTIHSIINSSPDIS